MIPKTIHYCWFGGKPLPESAKKCIASWRKFFPDYKIVEWNETNFDVNAIPYTAQAYAARKYAFVSDYARFLILYNQGGIYFDTDVEVIKPFDDIVERGAFMGIELAAPKGAANPGLGLGVAPGLGLYKEILDKYVSLSFLNPDGSPNLTTVVTITTDILRKHGLKDADELQEVAGVYIYPNDFFNPLDNNTGKLQITPNTRSIHWYSMSWVDINPWRVKISRFAHRIFGYKFPYMVRRFLKIK